MTLTPLATELVSENSCRPSDRSLRGEKEEEEEGLRGEGDWVSRSSRGRFRLPPPRGLLPLSRKEELTDI